METGRKLLVHSTAKAVRNKLPPGTRRRVDRVLKALRANPHVSLPNLSPMTRQYTGVKIVQGPDFKIFYSVVSDATGDYAKVAKIESVNTYGNPGGHLWKSIATSLALTGYEFRFHSFYVVKGYRAIRLRIENALEQPPS
jgi:hypothetical protein